MFELIIDIIGLMFFPSQWHDRVSDFEAVLSIHCTHLGPGVRLVSLHHHHELTFWFSCHRHSGT